MNKALDSYVIRGISSVIFVVLRRWRDLSHTINSFYRCFLLFQFRLLCLSKTGDEWGLCESLNFEDFPLRICCSLRTAPHYACNKTIASLSNNISDRNEDVKKAVDMLGKATTLHVHHTYFVHFLKLHDCNLKMSNFKFYRFFLPLNVVPKSILEKFAHI